MQGLCLLHQVINGLRTKNFDAEKLKSTFDLVSETFVRSCIAV